MAGELAGGDRQRVRSGTLWTKCWRQRRVTRGSELAQHKEVGEQGRRSAACGTWAPSCGSEEREIERAVAREDWHERPGKSLRKRRRTKAQR